MRFGARLDKINRKNGGIYSVTVGGEEIPCDTLILATGHSARDTFSMLITEEFELIRKPFSVGVRIEHLQSDINRALYGDFANHTALAAADYKLSARPDNRGVYTFCMCPGGEVINASSENGGIAVNGMSRSRRDGVAPVAPLPPAPPRNRSAGTAAAARALHPADHRARAARR